MSYWPSILPLGLPKLYWSADTSLEDKLVAMVSAGYGRGHNSDCKLCIVVMS